MNAHFDFSYQLGLLTPLFLNDQEILFQRLLADLEFRYYTQPLQFNQLTSELLQILHTPHAQQSSLSQIIYDFLYHNFIVLSKQQQRELLLTVSRDFPLYQHAPVQWRVVDLLGEKFANKDSLHLAKQFITTLAHNQHSLLPPLLEKHILYASDTNLKKQALHYLRKLTQDDDRPTRQEAQASLNRVEKQLNPRIYRTIC